MARSSRTEYRARNAYYDMAARLVLFIGGMLIVVFLWQIYTLGVKGETIRKTWVEAMMDPEVKVDEATGRTYHETHYHAPTADNQYNYVFNSPRIGIIRRFSGWLFTRFYQNTGWTTDIVNDITLYWLLITLTALAVFVICKILEKKNADLLAKQGKGEHDGLLIEDFAPLCDNRMLLYLLVLAVAIVASGPLKKPILLPVIAVIFVVLAETWCYIKQVILANPSDPKFAKERRWIKLVAWVDKMTGYKRWGESENRFLRWLGKCLFVIFTILLYFPSKIFGKIRDFVKQSADTYDQRYSQNDED